MADELDDDDEDLERATPLDHLFREIVGRMTMRTDDAVFTPEISIPWNEFLLLGIDGLAKESTFGLQVIHIGKERAEGPWVTFTISRDEQGHHLRTDQGKDLIDWLIEQLDPPAY